MPSILLAASVTTAPKSRLDPIPHTYFNLRCEGDERIWRGVFFDEDEINAVGLLAVGDSLSVVGLLNIHPATDSLGRRRLAFEVIGRQLLLLRRRSPAAVRASNFLDPPAAGGIVARC